jgi:hypothetical protein
MSHRVSFAGDGAKITLEVLDYENTLAQNPDDDGWPTLSCLQDGSISFGYPALPASAGGGLWRQFRPGPILSPNDGEKHGAPDCISVISMKKKGRATRRSRPCGIDRNYIDQCRSSVTPRTLGREPRAQVSVQTKDANLGHQAPNHWVQ